MVLLLCVSGEISYTGGGGWGGFAGIQAELNPHSDAFWKLWEEAGK